METAPPILSEDLLLRLPAHLGEKLLSYVVSDNLTTQMLALWEEWLRGAVEVAERASATRDGQPGSSARPAHPAAQPRGERARLAGEYLRGEGIEVGALHNPLWVPSAARVRYVDQCDEEQLRLLYAEIADGPFVLVDVVDDGETLATLPDESQDFVISNHFLEHCHDPIGALQAHTRVLREGGVLYCAIPDARRTFDNPRERTSYEHLWRDHVEGPHLSRRDHYRDWSLHVNGRRGIEHEAWWRMLDALDYSIHFHVWEPRDALEVFTETRRRLALPLELRESVQGEDECIFVLQKHAR